MEMYMNDTSLIQVKVDTATKSGVTELYENLGLDIPTAIRIFLKKSLAVGGLPFELKNESSGDRWAIYEKARKSIQENNVPEMTLEEINAEINAARNS